MTWSEFRQRMLHAEYVWQVAYDEKLALDAQHEANKNAMKQSFHTKKF